MVIRVYIMKVTRMVSTKSIHPMLHAMYIYAPKKHAMEINGVRLESKRILSAATPWCALRIIYIIVPKSRDKNPCHDIYTTNSDHLLYQINVSRLNLWSVWPNLRSVCLASRLNCVDNIEKCCILSWHTMLHIVCPSILFCHIELYSLI